MISPPYKSDFGAVFGKATENQQADRENPERSGNRYSKASYGQRLAQEYRVNQLNDPDHRIQGIELSPPGVLNEADVIYDRCEKEPHHEEHFNQVLQILKKRH